MYTSRLKQDNDDDDNKKPLPDTDYNVMMALEQERNRRALRYRRKWKIAHQKRHKLLQGSISAI